MRGLAVAAVMVIATGCASSEPREIQRLLATSESEHTGWTGVGSAASDAAMISSGRKVAERECASCHAIDRTSASPNRDAPPLRDVLAMYDPDQLAYRFIDAMRVGHDDMPLFDFDVRSADALVAYIQSIS